MLEQPDNVNNAIRMKIARFLSEEFPGAGQGRFEE